MRVASKIAVGSGLTAALLVGVLLYDLSLVARLARDNRELSEITLRTAMIPLEQSRLLNEIEEFTRKYRVTGDPAYASGVDGLQREFELGLAELAALDSSDREKIEIGRLESEWRAYSRRILAVTGRRAEAPVSPGAVDEIGEDQILESLERVRRQVAVVGSEARASVAVRVAQTAAAADRARRVSWIGALLALGLGLFVLALTVRSIHRPLARLVAGTRQVAEGNFAYRLERSGSDEFAGLATSFNEMVRRLAELDGMKEDFLAHVSHELKTPLVAMQETNELLLESIPGELNQKQRRLLELNLEAGKRLSTLISRILDLARMQAGVMEYDVGRHDLVALVQTAVSELESRARRDRGQRIHLEVRDRPLPALCDRDRLIQVVENLLDNALKHSPDNATVEVRVGTSDATGQPALLTVEVADRGPGVPEAERERIFDKFHQTHSHQTHSRQTHGHQGSGRRGSGAIQGVGLGLAISKEIVEAHNGRIEVSENPGGGSLFRFTVPAARAVERSEPSLSPSRATGVGSLSGVVALTILLACTSVGGVGDMYFESGRYREAAAAYESYLESDSDDLERRRQTLYRLGLSYAVPGTSIHDPRKSVEVLDELLAMDPQGSLSVEARLLRDLQRETLERGEQAVALQGEIAALGAELEGLQSELARARAEAGDGEREIAELTVRIEDLRGEISRLTVELGETEDELARLKAIDLGPSSR